MNFKKLAKIYQKQALVALEQYIKVDSTYDEKTVDKNNPYGKKVSKGLAYFEKLGRDNGFKTKNYGNRVVELTYGDEGPLIGIYGHSDVVPATGKWTYGPFSGTYKDGVVYGRGAIDDKGPMVAAFYAVKLLKDNNLIKGYRVKIVSGGDEERGSSCLNSYFNEYKGESPKYGFTPDADWPLIYGEKGMGTYIGTRVIDLSPVIALEGGEVFNQVCDNVLVTLKKDKKFEDYAVKEGNVDNLSNDAVMILRFKGKSAHGSTPEKGVNAIAICFNAIGTFYKMEDLVTLGNIIKSSDGAYFGGNATSPELGSSTFNYGKVSYDGKVLKLGLDYRYGETVDPKDAINKLNVKSKMSFTLLSGHEHLLFDKNSPLVKLLMKAYKRETLDLFAKPFTIGGGTYAKEAKNTVAFGACFAKRGGNNMHSPDEFMHAEDLLKDIAIYARAVYLLGKDCAK